MPNPFDSLGLVNPAEDIEALDQLARAAGGSVAVEIGSWVGSSALVLARYFQQVFCIDPFEGNPNDCLGPIAAEHGREHIFQTFCRNCHEKLFTGITPIVMPSEVVAKVWPDRLSPSFVFIDGRHDYEFVRADIECWWRLLAPAGVMAVHDFGWYDGVSRAVEELLPQRQLAGASIAWAKKP